MSEHNTRVATATKWSAITEIVAKLISPISTVILARILLPEAFGVVATVTMIISFAEIFSDAGFQKYLIQKSFSNDTEESNSTNVAFWSNLTISIILWGIIIIFKDEIAKLVGNPGLGNVLVVACISIPLAAFSSIQMALFKRNLNFKGLFKIRLVGITLPIIITIPLAFIFKSYWALIIGNIAVHFSNAILLTIYSKWRPSLYYNFTLLKTMFSFSGWIIIDTILVWATLYVDIFFIGRILNQYYLGIYKTSISTVEQIIAVITAVILPVMLPALARLQNEMDEFKKMLLKFQKYVGLFLLPIGCGIFIYRELLTQILLGSKWMEASEFIGIWGLISAITIIFSRFSSVVYPAIGKPRFSVLAQFLHLIVLIPSTLISIQYGFETLYWTRSLIRIELIVVNMILVYYLIKLSPLKMIDNIKPYLISSSIMTLIAILLLQLSNSYIWIALTIIISAGIYFAIISLFPNEKKLFLQIIHETVSRFRRK